MGDVASFYDEVLMVFNCGLDDFCDERPHPVAHLPVVIDGERRHAAADESHLEVVERDIREAKPFHESLRHQRLANMAAATKKYYHMHLQKPSYPQGLVSLELSLFGCFLPRIIRYL